MTAAFEQSEVTAAAATVDLKSVDPNAALIVYHRTFRGREDEVPYAEFLAAVTARSKAHVAPSPEVVDVAAEDQPSSEHSAPIR